MAQLHFYQEPTPLDKNKHAKLKLDRSGDFSYAANVNAVPVAGVEFFKCSRHFPVVFVKNSEKGYIPLALLSLRKDSHEYGDKWEDLYVPNYIRRYPFVLSEDNLVVIDNKAPQLNEEKGEDLFADGGEPTETLKGIIGYLEQLQVSYKATDEFVKALQEKDMLQVFSPRVKVGQGNINFGEMFIVNEKKILELSDTEAADWLKRGWIAWCYAQLHSLESIHNLVKLLVANGIPDDMKQQAQNDDGAASETTKS